MAITRNSHSRALARRPANRPTPTDKATLAAGGEGTTATFMGSIKFDDRATSMEPSTPAMAHHLRHSMEPLMAAQSRRTGEIHAPTTAAAARARSTATPLNGRAGTNATRNCKNSTLNRRSSATHHALKPSQQA